MTGGSRGGGSSTPGDRSSGGDPSHGLPLQQSPQRVQFPDRIHGIDIGLTECMHCKRIERELRATL